MKGALSAVLVIALLGHVAAHVSLLIGFARARSYKRVIGALLFPPLAPLWGYESGWKRRALAWVIALVVYAVGVALA